MKRIFAIAAMASTLLAPQTGLAQDAAGRVLAAAGDVTIVRGGQKLAAPAGTPVRPGDTVELGTQSNAQIRFTDESIVALRSETSFRVAEYQYSASDSAVGRAFFNLVKGGMRTVTGVIGRRNTQNYGVQTATATIGIRGTHYTLVECAANCRNADGSAAPAGTYGSVTDGRIGVTNQSGERQFGADQYFHVASATAAPQQLVAPPTFLRDPLESRTRTQQQRQEQQQARAAQPAQQQQTQAQQTQAQQGQAQQTATAPAPVLAPTGQSGETAGARLSGVLANHPQLAAALLTNAFQTTNQVSISGASNVVETGFTGTVFYRLRSDNVNIPTSCDSPPCSPIVRIDVRLGINPLLQRATVGVDAKFADGGILNVGTPASSLGIPITISGGQVVFDASINRADFPRSQGAFRCFDCSVPNQPGFLDVLGARGTVTKDSATLQFFGSNAGGGGSFDVTLGRTDVETSKAAAVVGPEPSGSNFARSSAFFNTNVNASGQLTRLGPQFGAVSFNVNTAVNTTVGSDAAAGLVWGKWTGGGVQITDFNYVTGNSSPTQVHYWITGEAANTLPRSLGTLTFTPVGSHVNNGAGVLNSATLVADFVNRTYGLSINATNVAAGNTFQMTGTNSFSPTSSRFSAGFDSVTCTGPCAGGTPSGSYAGFFAGSQAQGAGVVFTAGFFAGSQAQGAGVVFTAGFGAGTGVTGVVALKR
jgi:hypothetical protein